MPYAKRQSRFAKGVKAGRATPKRKLRYYYGPTANASAATIQAMVRRTLAKNVETKRANFTSTDGTEIFHNNFITLNNKILATTQGTLDPQATSLLCRVGDELKLKGLAVKFMVELNERYSDVTFRFMIIKCAKGDAPTRDTLWSGISGNKMIDTFNTERYTILMTKTFKVKAGNTGISQASFNGGYDNATTQTFSRSTRIMKFWIPGSKFRKDGLIKYENGSDQVKFYDYHAILYAYSNWTTLQDVYYVGRINDYVQTMYFKDA